MSSRDRKSKQAKLPKSILKLSTEPAWAYFLFCSTRRRVTNLNTLFAEFTEFTETKTIGFARSMPDFGLAVLWRLGMLGIFSYISIRQVAMM